MKKVKVLARFVFALAGTAFAVSAYAQTILKFSHTDQQQGARQAAAQVFAKKVEEYTQGRYKVQVFCCSQLGNDPKNIEQLALGGVDFTVSATGSYAGQVPTLNLTMMPFIIDTYAQGWKFYDESKWLQAQFDKAPPKGFRFLATWEAGFRNMTTREPLNSPADAKGKKLRTFPNEMMRWQLEAMGFGIQIMPLPEVYLAIQQGAVAGQENPIDTIYSNKFYEVAPNVTLTNHVYSPIPLAVSEKTWQRFSPADQQAVLRAAKEVAPFQRNMIKDNDEKLLASMESKGAKINRKPNIEAFRKSVEPVYVKAREKYGADVDQVLTEAAAVRKAVK
ncbi:MAG: TRAP transporter substrate-binding protein [Burkholderiaceae bacterium]|jgi:tripartite ATP-independent transporter DctP family solute receptor|nr:TRAP transporter substrate-binding protein [Burkholderiaceae bacterium]